MPRLMKKSCQSVVPSFLCSFQSPRRGFQAVMKSAANVGFPAVQKIRKNNEKLHFSVYRDLYTGIPIASVDLWVDAL